MKYTILFFFTLLAFTVTAQVRFVALEEQEESVATFVQEETITDSVMVVTDSEILHGTRTVTVYRRVGVKLENAKFYGVPVFRVAGEEVKPSAYCVIEPPTSITIPNNIFPSFTPHIFD